MVFLLLIDIVYKTLAVDNLLHKRWERLPLIGGSRRLIGDHTGVKINLNFIPGVDGNRCLGTFNDRKSDIDGIPVKNPGECLCDDTADACRFDCKRRVLSR